MLDTWELELRERILQHNLTRVRTCNRIHMPSAYDDELWHEIDELRRHLAKDTQERVSLYNALRQALDAKKLRRAEDLQLEMDDAMHR